MPIDFRLELSNTLKDAQRGLEEELRNAETMGGDLGRQLVDEIGGLDANQNRSTFASETAPGGSGWPELSPDYAERKRKARPGRKKLVWDGPLRQSATTARADGRIARVASGKIELGTNHPLAAIHQFGFRGVVSRKAHHRNLGTSGSGFRILPKSGKSRAQVRATSYRLVIPARPFIGKGAEAHEAIKARITKVLVERLHRATRGRVRNLQLTAARAAGRLVVVETG